MGTGKDQPRGGTVLPLVKGGRAAAKVDRIANYWNSVRGKRLVPSRCEIDPRGLEGALGHAFILERITGELARFRIAGSHLSDVVGLELRQMPLSALFLPGSREILADALQAVFEEPAVVRMTISSPGGFGRDALHGELILLPLRSDLGDIDRVLGGLVLDGKVGRTPRRIEIINQSRQSLTGYAGPAPRSQPALPAQQSAPRGPQKTPEREPVTQGHLRLVISND